MQDDYIRIRCSSVQKSLIVDRAAELDLSMTDYILRCVTYERCHPDSVEDMVFIPVSRETVIESLQK